MRPPPGRFRARRLPPRSAACSAAIARPRPDEPAPVAPRDGSAFQNRSNRCGSASGGTPGPRSATTTTVAAGDRGERDLDGRARGVGSGVVQQVAEDPLQPPRIGVHHDRLRRQHDGRGRVARRHDGRHQPAEVDRLDRRLLRRGVEAGDLEQVVDQRPQPAHVRDQQLRGPPPVRRQPVERALEERGLRDERGQRRPELVRHVRHEPPVLALRLLQPRDGHLERVGHPVEVLGPAGHLDRAAGRDPGIEVAVRDPPRGPCPGGDRPEDAAGDQAGRDEGEQDRDQPARKQAEPELCERILDGPRREHEVERWAGRLAPADDEGRLATDRLPRVAQLAPGHDVAQRRRDPRQGVREAGGCPRDAVTEVGDDLGVAAQPELLGQAARRERLRVRRRGIDRRQQDRQVEVRLLAGVRDEPVTQRGIDERVDADADQGDGQRHEQDERDRETRAEAAHRVAQASRGAL